jgi:hypothetical protein
MLMDKNNIHTVALWVGPLFFLLVTIKEVYVALQFSELANLNIQQALSLWGSEINPGSNFTSSEVGAILRIDRAIYSFIIFSLWSFFSYSQKVRANDKNT